MFNSETEVLEILSIQIPIFTEDVYHLFHIIRIDLFHHPVLPDVASTVPGCGDLGKASHVTRACSVTSDSL